MKRRLLITGGSGYLGRWVAELARQEWHVTATYATSPGKLGGVDWAPLDVRDTAALEALFESGRPDVVVHTAALNPGQGNDFVGVNVGGTNNVAHAAAVVGARLIHISTDVVFDGVRGNYAEADTPNPLTDYGQTKADAEQAVVDSGAAAAIVRTSLIYGWRPTIARSAQWMIDAAGRGEPIRLWADEMRNPIWVESLAAAIVELAGLDHTGPIHVGGAESVSRYDFGLALLRFHGLPAEGVEGILSPADANRPLNCTLDSSLARALLTTDLPGVSEVLR
ncbi:MAG: SDR family oxidoreductase [bacterium]|nr:SDR family oxidoreductase [bacterium]